MEVVKTVDELKVYINRYKAQGETIGFVPTMGYLHNGHLSLARAAKEKCSKVIMSIFVNPTQFGPNEDYATYPRDLERDCELADSAGVDLVFNPSVEEIYPAGYTTYVNVEQITEKLCGASRPGHFRGVTTIVLKLFNLVKPDFAFFGQKDAQQVAVIKKMVYDLNCPVQVVACPIIRESDGLAMSSRNTYLSPQERKAATVLNRSLKKAAESFESGERSGSKLRESIKEILAQEPLANIDYVSVSDPLTLEELDFIDKNALFAIAVKIGKTRLIDNLLVEG